MTSELEKTFFDTFGIEKILPCATCCFWHHDKDRCYWDYENDTECKAPKVYPKITDRILLELIRLGLNYDFVIHAKSKDELKEKLLTLLIRNDVEFKQRVRTLFKENTNDR